jgi:signal peptidase I
MEDEPLAVEAASDVSEPRPQGSGNDSKPEEVAGEQEESALREWFELIGRAGFWALVLYLFVFQVSVVEGPSMQPNFQTADRLVIDKLTFKFTSIRRLDVIVFQAVEVSRYQTNHDSKDYIKRVIGLPGEHVRLKGNSVYVNGVLLPETFPFSKDFCYYGVPDEFVVPPQHYFVMGDNRGDSKDSRSSALGFVPESQIRGLARLRFMPLSRWTWFARQ